MSTSHFLKPLRVDCRFVFIDDSMDYLDTIKMVLKRGPLAAANFYDRPETLDPVLHENALRLERERSLLHAIAVAQDPEQEGAAAVLALKYFASKWRRDIIGVLVADFDMPLERGDFFCKRHKAIGLQRVLLTGKADQSQAINAFKDRQIEDFIGKNEQRTTVDASGKSVPVPFLDILRSELERQPALSAEIRGEPLMPVLDRIAAENKVLQTPAAADALRRLLDEYRISEYMMLGFPLGILGLSSDEKAYWFQIETAESKVSQLEVSSGEVADRVSRGETALNFSWMAQLGRDPTEVPLRALSTEPYLAVGVCLLDNLPSDLQPAYR